MDFDQALDNAKRSTADQRAAHQLVLDASQDAADKVLLRKSADTILDLAKVMALVKENPT